MFIPTGERYSVTATGHEKREITCEKCGCQYVYFVQASAVGQGFSPMFLAGDRAESQARGQALLRVKSQLRGFHLPIHCPSCGYYQAHMVKLIQRARLKRLAIFVLLPMIWVVLKALFTDARTAAELGVAKWGCVTIAFAALAAGWYWAKDDNSDPQSRALRDPTCGGVSMLKSECDALAAEKPAASATRS